MSLRIFYSDRIEDLAAHLKANLVAERGKGELFDFSKVVVPNTNIAKWLQIRVFADEPSLCMGVEFPFMEQSLFDALVGCLDEGNRPRLLPMHAYANGIMAILQNDADARLAPFRRYVADGDDGPLDLGTRSRARMAWQLSVKLADLIDKYEVHRRGIIERWLSGRCDAGTEDPVEIAEAVLAHKLLGCGGVYPPNGCEASLRQLFDRVKARPANRGEARRMHVFGVSTLSPLQAEIIHWLSRTRDIVLYHNNVCLEYWGDLETKGECVRRLGGMADADADIRLESPLLQSWGRAGRETLRLLVDLEEAGGDQSAGGCCEWTELPPSPAAEQGRRSMLAAVKASVRRRTGEVGRVERQDASIQVVAAPGIRREVEMAYNAILGAVWKPEGSGERPWSDCSFSDIAVLVPDMKTYRPVIEAVFDARGEIPYGLIDASACEYSHYLQGFMALMSVARDGLSRETVFAVLDCSCVQRALGFTPDDARQWRRYAKEAGAFDGFDGERDAENVSWRRALSRLRLGMVASDRPGLAVWEGGDASALRFSEIVETLHRELSPLAGARLVCTPPASPAGKTRRNWADTLRRVAGQFLSADGDDRLEDAVSRQLFQALYALDKVSGAQSLDFVVAAVEEFVGGVKCQKGGYLTHGVTVAGLQPMRPVPFKQVFVLGMGEGRFPGQDSATTLDVRGAARTLGDMRPSEIDKFLFLETLMATAERLVISYPCLDAVKDAEMFPSGVVRELEDFLEGYVLPEGERFREVRLPLIERGEAEALGDAPADPVAPIAWRDEWHAGTVPTYSNVERAIAQRMASPRVDPLRTDATGRSAQSCGKRPAITAKELSEFLESPLRAVLHRRLGVAIEGYRDESADMEAPLELAARGPDKWRFERRLLDEVSAGTAGADAERVYRDFAEHGHAPDADGALGRCSLAKVKDAVVVNSEDFMALKRFVAGFLPEGARLDPVRSVVNTADGERLYLGQTDGWVKSGDGVTCSALVFGQCGDGARSRAMHPPKTALEPFVTWLMIAADAADDGLRTLHVGIADVDQSRCSAWSWRVTPKEARSYVDGLVTAYLGYLGAPEADGSYIDYGYSKMAAALESAFSGNRKGGPFPQGDEEWRRVMDGLKSDDFDMRATTGFNNSLVVGKSVEAFRRMPDESDMATVKDRFERLFRLPLSGVRQDGVHVEGRDG